MEFFPELFKCVFRDYPSRATKNLLLPGFLALLLFLAAATPISAETFVVTNTTDTGDAICDIYCSLREAIAAANDTPTDDIINFDPVVFSSPQTIVLTYGQLIIYADSGLTINGPGAGNLAISGNGASRILQIQNSYHAFPGTIISGITFKNGIDNGGGAIRNWSTLRLINTVVTQNRSNASGGGIENTGILIIVTSTISNNQAVLSGGGIKSSDGLLMTKSTVSHNIAGSGGGIDVSGLAGSGIEDSTIHNNTAAGHGGGILNFWSVSGSVDVRNCTITGNKSSGDGGGIYGTSRLSVSHSTVAGNMASGRGGGIAAAPELYSALSIANTIIGDNTSSRSGPDFSGTFSSSLRNLIENPSGGISTSGDSGNILGQDPRLGPLADNGGPTLTLALLPGSLAVDAGITTNFPPTDQRGIARPKDGDRNQTFLPDIGAFERDPAIDRATPFRFDFDGDGRTDVSVWRPSDGNWHLSRSTAGYAAYSLGGPGDQIMPGDFDGDGKADVAVWRPANGNWSILNSGSGTYISYTWGAAGDVPLLGDYDDDGKADVAVYRPADNTFYILQSRGGTQTKVWGVAGDVPVTGDFDGDSQTDFAVRRPSTGELFIDRSTAGYVSITWGIATDIPVHIDYDGDGKDDVAVWRPSTGEWFMLRSSDGAHTNAIWGATGDIPVPGDYDGDGKADISVVRNGTWHINQSTGDYRAASWGVGTDIAIPGRYAF